MAHRRHLSEVSWQTKSEKLSAYIDDPYVRTFLLRCLLHQGKNFIGKHKMAEVTKILESPNRWKILENDLLRHHQVHQTILVELVRAET
jgi:hypothetical protein